MGLSSLSFLSFLHLFSCFVLTKSPHHLPTHTGKFLPTRRTPGISTSELLERIVSGYRKREYDAKLEKIGARGLMASGSDYDDMSPRGSRRGSRRGSGGDGLEPMDVA